MSGGASQRPARTRRVFWLCLAAALLLMALAIYASLMLVMSDAALFERSLMSSVDYRALGMDGQTVGSFADETIAYLRGEADAWSPIIATVGGVMPIPDDFKAHMATVRGWVSVSPTALVIGLATALALIACAVGGGSRARGAGFSPAGWYAGALLPLAALGALALWGYADFNGLWAWLHETFIPDGIFSASEPIMALFPSELFAGYAKPVGITFLALAAAVLALPAALYPLSRRIQARG